MAHKIATLLLLATETLADSTYPGNSSRTTITIDVKRTYQRFDGMGFSEAFQRGTQIYGADGLSAANTTRVLDLLFSNTTGAGMDILRNGIGSSLTNPYDLMKSIETTSPGSLDYPPDYNWEGTIKPGFGLDNGQVQLTKDAISRGVGIIYADAWSAPGFMKNNSNDSYDSYLCGVPGIECPTGDWRQAYADYLVQYLKYYKQEGIDVNYVGYLNEPDLNVSYASMLSSGEQAASFLKLFQPTLEASGLNTKIACCDGSGWEEQRTRLSGGIQDAGAESTLDIVTSHGYSSPLGTPFDISKPVWQREWADLEEALTYAWYANGSSGEGLTWANHIQEALAASNVSAFLHWIGAGNTTTNTALILLHGDTSHVSKRLWAFAHHSRTVTPEGLRDSAAVSGPANVTATAFRNPDGSAAVQVINNIDNQQSVEIAGLGSKPSGTVKTSLTNNEDDLAVSTQLHAHGELFGEIPAFSVLTFVVGTT